MNIDQVVADAVELASTEAPVEGLIWQVLPIDSLTDGTYRLDHVSSEPVPSVRVVFFSVGRGSAAIVGRGMADLRPEAIGRMVRDVLHEMARAAAPG
jgi:hypothetical protein